ncbi:MAG: hypothetical protein ACK5KM_16240, partial [Hyphomicrobiaceae bacterium]
RASSHDLISRHVRFPSHAKSAVWWPGEFCPGEGRLFPSPDDWRNALASSVFTAPANPRGQVAFTNSR